jgi:hypothetical protein
MDYNFTRGQILFWETINKNLENFNKKDAARLVEIAKGFENSVAIMPDQNGVVYAAKRLAEAILDADLSEQKEGSVDTVTTNILVKYFAQAQNNSISKSHFLPKGDNLSGNFGKLQDAESDEFEKELRSTAEAEIDLLEDFDLTEYSVEGLRKKLIVPSNFDKDKDQVPDVQGLGKTYGKIIFSNAGEIESVECPHCNSSDVFVISFDKYGCLKCDDNFYVPMEIGDNLN